MNESSPEHYLNQNGSAGAANGAGAATRPSTDAPDLPAVPLMDGVYRPGNDGVSFRVILFQPPSGFGGNSGAFTDPLTLDAMFPEVDGGPREILAAADNLLDITGPASALTAQLTHDRSARLIEEIQSIDPTYRFETLGTPTTLAGQVNQIDGLRLDRAAAYYKIRNDAEPLQVETARFLQRSADTAYADALQLEKEGQLNIRLSRQEAIGNYVDQRTRNDLKKMYGQLGLTADRSQVVRVNSREHDSSAGDLTYRRPDARVGDVAFDVTIAHKTLATPQVRGFFNSDFKPSRVIIVRPSQLGPGSTYSITRQGR